MQLELVKKIVGLIPPYRIAKDAGQKVHREYLDGVGARFYVAHPELSEERLYIAGNEFIEAGKSSGFFGGTAFDYLGLLEGSIEAGVDVFFERYKDKIHNITSYEEGLVKEFLTKNAKRSRRGFDWLDELTGNYQNSGAFHDLLSWQRGKGINPLYLNHWAYMASPVQVVEFFESLYDSERDFPFDIAESGNYLVVPYYNTWSNISHFAFLRPHEGTSERLDLNPARLSWAGLHGSPHYRPMRTSMFFNNAREAMLMQSFYRNRLDDSLCLHSCINKDFADAGTMIFQRGLILADNRTNFTMCTRISEAVDQLHVQRFDNYSAHGDSLSWPQYIAEELQQITKEDGELSPRADAMLSAIELDGNMKTRIIEELKRVGASDLTVGILTNWSGGATFKFKSCTVEETRHGYLVTYPNRSDQTLITNFTLSIDRNVVMGDTGQVLMTGTIRMGNTVFPYEMDRKVSSTPRTIEEGVLKAFNRWVKMGVRDKDDQRVPIITVPDQARILAGVIGTKCANVSYDEGYGNLGWVRDDVFIAPNWMRKELALTEGKSPVVLDQFEHVASYRFSPFPQQNEPRINEVDFLTHEARAALRTLVVWLVRGAFDYEVCPEKIQDSVAARNLIKAICSVFGQVSPMTVNPSARRSKPEKLFKGLNRLPGYAHSNNPDVLCDIAYPVWVLGDGGINVTTSYTRPQLNAITNLTYHLVNRVIDWIMTGSAGSIISFNTDPINQNLEAGRILEQIYKTFGADTMVDAILATKPSPRWVRLLGGDEDDVLGRILSFDLESGMYVLRSRKPNDIDFEYSPGELVDEVKSQDLKVVERHGRYWIPRDFVEEQMGFARDEPFKFGLYKRAGKYAKEDKRQSKESTG